MDLSRTQLKFIAVFAMLIDHIGLYLYPHIAVFRIIGRISFPIFAYFIAEGFHYTHNIGKYFVSIFACAVITQFAILNPGDGLNVLFTFLISLFLIFLAENKKKKYLFIFLALLVLNDFFKIIQFDYGFCGIVLPLYAYFPYLEGEFSQNKQIFYMLIPLTGLCFCYGIIQAFSFLSVSFLMLYNKNKPCRSFKYFFYIFFPLHHFILSLFS